MTLRQGNPDLSPSKIPLLGWLMVLAWTTVVASPSFQPSSACQAGAFSEEQIQAVRRTPPDLPLADLSSYGPRHTPRSPDAKLNGVGCETNSLFRYGAGKADITGPALGQGLAGYADPTQTTAGLANRQHARAFAFSSQCGNREGHAMLVVVDNGLMHGSVVQGVLERLNAIPNLKGRYSKANLMLQATHTHSAGGGQSFHDLYNIVSLGFDQQSYDAIVSGLVRAIQQADIAMRSASPAPVFLAQDELLNGNVNRSAVAYTLDPPDERARYVDTSGREVNTNRMMVLLKLPGANGENVGALNFYPVHGTSMAQTNRLLSGDNKGYAAWRMEQAMGGAGEKPFVAGFFQADEGDVSPNLFMPELTEQQVRDLQGEAFIHRGGGANDEQSTMISGYKQFAKARDLYASANEPLRGEVKSAAIYLDMTRILVEDHARQGSGRPRLSGAAHRTCEPALGVSFAAGAEDGRGPFTEGAACPMSAQQVLALAGKLPAMLNALVIGAIPSELELPLGCALNDIPLALSCQAEKPVLLPLSISPFTPGQALAETVVPIQIIVIGQLGIVALPWEVTTMSGRRLRLALMEALQDAGVSYVVVAGLANGYTHYLPTREEYASQQYEGASDIFGPWTLQALQQELLRLAGAMRKGVEPQSPYAVPDRYLIKTLFVHHPSLNSGTLPQGTKLGDVVVQPKPSYQVDTQNPTVASAAFYAANPRLDLRQEESFVYVERQAEGQWHQVADDDSWHIKLAFAKDGQGSASKPLLGTVTWTIPGDTPSGSYRIRLEGASPNGPYVGITNAFEVMGCQSSMPQT